MKSPRIVGITAVVAVITAAAVTATAMPNIVSATKQQDDNVDLPSVPSQSELEAAQATEASREEMRQRILDSVVESTQRFAEVEAAALQSNENARTMSETAAQARNDAELARRQAETSQTQADQAQDTAGQVAAEAYRNGGASAGDVLLGDDDALAQANRNEQIADTQVADAENAARQAAEVQSLEQNAEAKAQAAQELALEEARVQAEREAEARRLAEQQERIEQTRQELVDALAELEGISEEAAAELVESYEQEQWDARLAEVLGDLEAQQDNRASAAPVTSPSNTVAALEQEAEEAEQTPQTEETPQAEPSPTESPSPTRSASASPSPSASPSASTSPSATSSPSASPSPTRTATPAPSQTPTRTATPTPSPTRTATPTPQAAPSQTPTRTQAPQTQSTPTPSPTQAAQQSQNTRTSTASSQSGSGWAQTAINWAVAKANEPGSYYAWGGNGPKGYDCSGFTLAAFQSAGKSLPRTSKAQYSAATQYVPLNQMRPGDLVFWSNNGSGSGVYHVAIYMGNNQIVHARNPQMGISVTALNYGGMHNILPMAGRY